jgi:hypothetical protein
VVLKPRYNAPGNWEKAKCRKMRVTRDYDPFFDEEDNTNALDFCNGDADGVICPIRNECLLFALTNNCKEGVWGGSSEITRKALRKRWPLKRGKEPRPEWKWMTQEQALGDLDLIELILEPDDEEEWSLPGA